MRATLARSSPLIHQLPPLRLLLLAVVAIGAASVPAVARAGPSSGSFHASGRLPEIDKAVAASSRGVNCIGIASPCMGAVVSWHRLSHRGVAGHTPSGARVRVGSSHQPLTMTNISPALGIAATGLPSDRAVLLDALVEEARDEEYVFGGAEVNAASPRPRRGGTRLMQSLARRIHRQSLSARMRPAGVRFLALTRQAGPAVQQQPPDVTLLDVDSLGAIHECEAVALGDEAEKVLGNYTEPVPIADMQPSDVLEFVDSVMRNVSALGFSTLNGIPRGEVAFSVMVLGRRGPPVIVRDLRVQQRRTHGNEEDFEAVRSTASGDHQGLRKVRAVLLQALQREAVKLLPRNDII